MARKRNWIAHQEWMRRKREGRMNFSTADPTTYENGRRLPAQEVLRRRQELATG